MFGSKLVVPVESEAVDVVIVVVVVAVAELKIEVIVCTKDANGSVSVVFADATVSMRSVEKTIAQTALNRNDG